MRICIPTETKEGIKAKVYGHFGGGPYFTVYDSEKNVFEVIDNSNRHHEHGACHPMALLKDKKVDAVACMGMGARAVQLLNDAGIKTYRVDAGTVEQAVQKFKSTELEEITVENACAQHGCHE